VLQPGDFLLLQGAGSVGRLVAEVLARTTGGDART
jgi:UDP-N-acetylmuramate-alanine ligase